MRTILIVEDDASFRAMLRTVLEVRGFRVLLAENAGEGLVMAAMHGLDAVITDYRMPCRNGLEFCRALRKQKDAALEKQPPIWVMTGSLELTTNAALASGALGVFRKPFRPLEISKAIERHLQRAGEPVNMLK